MRMFARAIPAVRIDVLRHSKISGHLPQDKGGYARAEPLYQPAWAIDEKVLGPNIPVTAPWVSAS